MIVDLDAFTGPLELLLNLIEKDKIDIYDIPINKITESYLDSIENIAIDSDEMIDFIVMASTLIEIKSKMLLPKQEESEEDPRDDLVEKLLEYKKAKEAAQALILRKDFADSQYTRLKEEIIIDSISVNLDEDIRALSKVFFDLINREDYSNIEESIISADRYKLEDYMNRIIQILKTSELIILDTEFFSEMPKEEIITYFLAMLELLKNKEIKLMEDEYQIRLMIKDCGYEEE